MAQAVIIRIAGMDQRLVARVREALLVRAATLAISMIRRRARQGLDVDGGPLAPYSERYAALRRAAGRQASIVDLTLTGHMLASMAVIRKSPREVVLGFSGAAPAARIAPRSRPTRGRTGALVTKAVRLGPGTVQNADKAAWANLGTDRAPPRPFFGLSRLNRVAIIARVARTLRLEK